MPASLFFAMERQINRIMAQEDLRQLAVITCSMGGDHVEKVQKALVVEQGEVYIIARQAIVAPDPDAISTLKSLSQR